MKRALDLASRGFGQTCPNPMVGCVIAREGRILGEGFHRRVGKAHAEVDALAALTEDPRGATMYVTLEPCSHHGRTPPCTEAILKAGIARVVLASLDPNPKAMGGMEILQGQGVSVEAGLLEKEALVLNHLFFNSLRPSRPHISLKLAMTLNGMIARQDGSSKWITGSEARAYVHRIRAAHQCILVGISTLLSDNPRLDARDYDVTRSPIPVILDRKGRVPAHLHLLENTERVIYFGPHRNDFGSNVEQIRMECEERPESWEFMLEKLHSLNLGSLFVEGGSEVAGFLLEHELCDWAYLFYGPRVFPLDSRPGLVSGKELAFESHGSMRALGDSFLLEGRFSCSLGS